MSGGSVTIACRGVCFDADGVLVDSVEAVDDAWRQVCAEYGLDPSEVFADFHGVRAIEVLRRHLAEGDARSAFQRLEDLEVATGPQTRALPGPARLLGELAGHHSVVTSGTRRLVTARLTGAGLGVPRRLVTADDVERGKPDALPYLRGAELLSLDPTTVVVFEDAPSGVVAASAAGCTSVGLRTTHPGDLPADHRIPDLDAVTVERDGNGLVLRLATG